MIKREMYMRRIRPFINTELIKVMTGLRRSGKSVMLELIKDELTEHGCTKKQFIALNFEKMENEQFCNAKELFHFSYQRYIENKRREAFGFSGTSIRILIRERSEKEQ